MCCTSEPTLGHAQCASVSLEYFGGSAGVPDRTGDYERLGEDRNLVKPNSPRLGTADSEGAPAQTKPRHLLFEINLLFRRQYHDNLKGNKFTWRITHRLRFSLLYSCIPFLRLT